MAINGLTGAPIHVGSWGTYDIGLTELLQRLYQPNNPLSPDLGSNLSNSIGYTNNPKPKTQPILSKSIIGPQTPIGINKTTSNNTTGGAPSGGTPTKPDPSVLQLRLNGIMSRLQLMKDEGARLLAEADETRKAVQGRLGTMYGGLQNTAMGKRDASVAEFNKAEGDTTTNYSKQRATERTNAQGTTLKNRALARALGIGGGSQYLDMQQANNVALGDKMSNLGKEQTGKYADISNGIAGSNNWFNQQSTATDQDYTNQLAENENTYADAAAKLNLNVQNYGLDSVDQAAQAEQDARNQLNSGSSYANNQGNILNTIMARANQIGSGITSRPNVDANLSARLNNNNELNNGTKLTTMAAPLSTGGVSNYYGDAIAKKKTNPWDEYIYGAMA